MLFRWRSAGVLDEIVVNLLVFTRWLAGSVLVDAGGLERPWWRRRR